MPSLVKSIALVAGTGIVLGLYSMAAGTPRRKREDSDGPDPLFIEPLLDRVEHLEGQLASAGAKGGEMAQVQSLKESIAAQEAELRALRVKVDETEGRGRGGIGRDTAAPIPAGDSYVGGSQGG